MAEQFEVRRVPVASLRPPADALREEAESAEHVRLLAGSDAELPSIVVHRATMRVIDGMHRLRAAELRGEKEISARFFDGSAQDAFVFAVRANVWHGLPLSLSERTAAAGRILRSHPQWSNRAIAAATGLSAKTVGAQRRRLGGAGSDTTSRIGRDGRTRPVSSAEGRRIAGRLILESPEASLRVIARQAGISPGTVRDVRARLSRGEDVVPPRQRARGNSAASQDPGPAPACPPAAGAAADVGAGPLEQEPSEIFRSLCRDPSLRMSEHGRQLLRMVEPHVLDPHLWDRVAESVPPHRAQIVSALATQCAERWQRLASRVKADDVPSVV
ncbi:ParB/RepB/Spo0J family partition protein [Streptomyces sp. WMMC897]|uniref:ParB/RepB/Spo0J family partition protein n=1 Tax=Streptomyces sp. WMMC897 TaxID=3014782 RepID=UPI0022B5F88E|nr:ParB/RepB/Spo0J family partition protein [Streptomyces sp. WMMC897]MCZ7416015.1 ParB/RepB/Spo0J family partition protein [Streptomyces sp. WMMC897]